MNCIVILTQNVVNCEKNHVRHLILITANLVKCQLGEMSIWGNVWVGKSLFVGNVWVGKCLFGEMSGWGNVFLGKCLGGEMSIWGNVFWGDVWIGEMSIWGNVFWGNVFWGNVFLGKRLWGNVCGEMSGGENTVNRCRFMRFFSQLQGHFWAKLTNFDTLTSFDPGLLINSRV